MERSLSRLTSLLLLLAALTVTSACSKQPGAASWVSGIATVADVIRAWAPSLALIVAFATLMYNANAQWLLKQHDMVSGYQLRFGAVVDAINKEIDAGRPTQKISSSVFGGFKRSSSSSGLPVCYRATPTKAGSGIA